MKCSCCRQEITSKDRFCPNCGENNEAYVEVVENSRPTPSQNINQPINRVPINPNTRSSNSSTQNNGSPVYVYSQTQVVTTVKEESKALGVCAIIFSVLGGWLGLVLSIIGLCSYKLPENRTLCKVGLGFCIGWFVLGIILGLSHL